MPPFGYGSSTFFTRRWLAFSIATFVASIAMGLVCVILLNKGSLNHVFTPIFQYLGIFKLIFPDKPTGALQFILSKSLFAFAYKDPRSALNLWTYEFDSITLLVYITASVSLGYCLAQYRNLPHRDALGALSAAVAGTVMLLFSVSYMTVIAHCSGATWVGFVALYGLGYDEFDLYPAYQWVCGTAGTVSLAWGYWQLRRIYKNTAASMQHHGIDVSDKNE